MSIKQDAGVGQFNPIKQNRIRLFLFLCIIFICYSHFLFGVDSQTLTYYLYISDFV